MVEKLTALMTTVMAEAYVFDSYQRIKTRVIVLFVAIAILLTVATVKIVRRRMKRKAAERTGPEEYLKYLNIELEELKFRSKTASNENERQTWLREMAEVRSKILTIEKARK